MFIRKNNYKLLFRHSCPLCRKVSLNIIPSKHFLTGDQKEAYIQQYIEERGARVCCNGTLESCQFGNECHYQHKQKEDSLSRVNESPLLYYEAPSFSNVDENNAYSFVWNDISVGDEPYSDSSLSNSIPDDNEEPNILKSVMDALAFAKLHEDLSNVEEPRSLHSWLR